MPPDLACAVHARGVVGTDLRKALLKCGAIRQIHYFLNDRSEREAFVTFKYKSDAVYAKTKHSFGDVQIFGITDEFWKNRYVESQNADPVKSGMEQLNEFDTFMPHAISQPTPAPARSKGDDYLSDPAGFAVHVEGEVHGSAADCKFTRFGPVRRILRFNATSGKPHAFIAFETRIAAAAARNAGHIDSLPIDALSRSEWMMKKYRELIQQDLSYSNGVAPSARYLEQGQSPPGSPRGGRTPAVVYERSSWTRETDTGRQSRAPPTSYPPRSRPDSPPRLGPARHEPPPRHEPPRHEIRHYPPDDRVLSSAPRPVYRDEPPRVPVDRDPGLYPSNGSSGRDSIGWKDSRDYPPSGYERERLSPGYSHPSVAADPRYDSLASRPRDYDDRGRQPPQRESARYSPYPQRSPVVPPPYPPRDRVPASPNYPPPLPVDARLDDIPRRERAPSADSRHLGRGLDGPTAPLTKPLSATATSEEALNTLKFMRDMQCQPSQYHIAAEKEPRFADAEALALEGIKVALSTQRPSEAAPLYMFLARLQGERFKTERNPALVLRLARDIVVNLDEATALSRQPLEPSMQSLRQEMISYTRSHAPDADVEMVDMSRPAEEDPDAQAQRLMDKLRRAREDMRRMEDDLDRERRERRRIQSQLADVQDNLARTVRTAKNDVEDLKKANDRHLERIAELERELGKKNAPSAPFVPQQPVQPKSASETPGDMAVDNKEDAAKKETA
ncbi:hypothetical protein FRC07_006974 [Ceratobasidium sp. 392]|nr:hypothetical protein FRC07_006974 [Ceratobasidium sp. 392]